jgi:PPK2 family polyphosphate:nucleotide phosphotransferase
LKPAIPWTSIEAPAFLPVPLLRFVVHPEFFRMLKAKLIERLRVAPGKRFRLEDHDPSWNQTPRLKQLGKKMAKQQAQALLADDQKRLSAAQELLWASDTKSVLIVLQAMDAGGKDGTIKHVMSGLNPQGVQVYSFKKPTAEELNHNFLWRYARNVPERGRIGIFNRSYYEDVLIVRVQPGLVPASLSPKSKPSKSFWRDRFEDINNFERHLSRNGTAILKFFLNISKSEQRRRLLARMEDPQKYWKFSSADLEQRAYWDQYAEAYQDALQATSTPWAPWYVIPADFKWGCRALVADIMTNAIDSLGLKFPQLDAEQLRALKKAQKRLKAE